MINRMSNQIHINFAKDTTDPCVDCFKTKSTIRKQSLFKTRKPLSYHTHLDDPKANLLLITEKTDFCNLYTVEPRDNFLRKKSKAIFKSNDTQSYISNSLYLITPLIHFWLCIVGLILYFRGKLLRQLESRDLNMSQNKSSYHALCTYSKICKMTNDVTNVRSSSPDLGPLGPSLSWWRRCTGKKGEQIF